MSAQTTPLAHPFSQRRTWRCQAAEPRAPLKQRPCIGFPKTSGGRGSHVRPNRAALTFTDVRHVAIAFGRELQRWLPGEVSTSWWKEERGERIFVGYNQSARDRTIASAYSVLPRPAAPTVGAAGLVSLVMSRCRAGTRLLTAP